MKLNPQDYKYITKNGLCLFYHGPFSQWWSKFKNQEGGAFKIRGHFYYDLSDFSKDFIPALNVDEFTVNSCEQHMMLSKAALFRDYNSFQKILWAIDPREVKALGREVRNFNEKRWDAIKYWAVLHGNIQKFSQNAALREFILGFPVDTEFVEASPYDKIWGIGLPVGEEALDKSKWRGQNLLGKVIGDVRKFLEK